MEQNPGLEEIKNVHNFAKVIRKQDFLNKMHPCATKNSVAHGIFLLTIGNVPVQGQECLWVFRSRNAHPLIMVTENLKFPDKVRLYYFMDFFQILT